MTALDAAIIELEAHIAHAQEAIALLRRFARVVEDAHEPPKHPDPPAPPLVTATIAGSPIAAVLDALKVSGEPLRAIDLCARTALSKETVRQALKELEARNQVRGSGKTSAKAWAPIKSRPRTAAGTPALLPAGPSSAAPPDVETVWNGRDKNGSLSGYQRKGEN